MSLAELRQRIHRAKIKFRYRRSVLFNPSIIVVKMQPTLHFGMHGSGVLDPAIMKYESINQFYVQFVVRQFPEPLSVFIGENLLAISNHPDFPAIPTPRFSYVIVRTVEMPIVEEKALYVSIIFVFQHGFTDLRVVLFMHDFISLDVKSPIRIRSNSAERFIGFKSKRPSTCPLALIPNGFDDSDLGGIDTADKVQGRILRLADGYHYFVTQRKDGGNGFDNRVIKLYRISNDGKTTDLHLTIPCKSSD